MRLPAPLTQTPHRPPASPCLRAAAVLCVPDLKNVHVNDPHHA